MSRVSTSRSGLPGHQPFEVRQEVLYRLVAAGKGLRADHRLQRAKDGQRPVAQGLALVLGHVEKVADHLDRDRGGEIIDQVHLALSGNGIEQALDQPDQVGLHAGDRARRERAHDQAADAGMGGRIVEDEARGVVLVEQGGTVLRRELLLLVRRKGLGVLVGRNQVVVAGQEMRAVRQPLDRLGLTQRAIGRVGVGIKLRRQLFEVEGGRQFARIQNHSSSYSLARRTRGDHAN
jgi:hypothetical protein